MTKLTDRRIAWLIRQAQGTAVPPETVGQMAARWGVTPRWLRKLLQRWRQSGVVPRLTPRRRPPGPPLTDEQKRQITEEWLRAPRGATKLYKALARREIHIPKMQIYRFGKAQGWVVPNPRKQRRRRYVRYERAHAGSLVHGDFHRTSEAHPHCILWMDDASRMILAGGEFSEATAAITTLEAARRLPKRASRVLRRPIRSKTCRLRPEGDPHRGPRRECGGGRGPPFPPAGTSPNQGVQTGLE